MKSISVGKSQKYFFNEWLFNGLVIILLSIAIFFIVKNDFNIKNNWYISCVSDYVTTVGNNSIGGFCENPLYNNYPVCMEVNNGEFCNVKEFSNGFTYGSPTPFIIRVFPAITILGFVVVLLLNHFLYNKGFSFKRLEEEGIDERDKDNSFK